MRKLIIIIVLTIVGFVPGFVAGVFYSQYRATYPLNTLQTQSTPATVDKVIDGDTLKVTTNGLNPQQFTVRLLGIDAPEKGEYLAQKATAAVSRLVLNKLVRLEHSNYSSDKYGRLLAFVWVDHETNLSLELVRQGLASVYLYQNQPVKYQSELEAAETQAKKEELGIWKK